MTVDVISEFKIFEFFWVFNCSLFLGFLIGIHSIKDWIATSRQAFTKKKEDEIKERTGKAIKENSRYLLTLQLKPIKTIGQRKAFSRQRVPEYSYVIKETGAIGILIIFTITEKLFEINFGFHVNRYSKGKAQFGKKTGH